MPPAYQETKYYDYVLMKRYTSTLVTLEFGDQLCKQLIQLLVAFHGPQLSSRMDHSEIPGRHVVIGLCVPGWRDVSLRSAENNHRRLLTVKCPALRILARDMAVNSSKSACGPV